MQYCATALHCSINIDVKIHFLGYCNIVEMYWLMHRYKRWIYGQTFKIELTNTNYSEVVVSEKATYLRTYINGKPCMQVFPEPCLHVQPLYYILKSFKSMEKGQLQVRFFTKQPRWINPQLFFLIIQFHLFIISIFLLGVPLKIICYQSLLIVESKI